MTLAEVKEILACEVLHGDDLDRVEIKTGCGCDLMSDVLRFVKPGALLLTGLTHTQVVRTAEMAEIRAICFVRGKKPDEETIRLAKARGIWLLATRLPLFESCGKLYRQGLRGC
ncbi:MAG: DRTGG domain-containing protein [candidate division KSB1 bacterium]|nr:DRTGG domain-containing protein [candidate division KSB1 bacterium]MDZ7303005.1 DRTGG domain-containing protein [candidate division KSB1 bacterium]MDZ7312487.1 DRTGG domain-containing protein [candidate division KSB1 bacterium]